MERNWGTFPRGRDSREWRSPAIFARTTRASCTLSQKGGDSSSSAFGPTAKDGRRSPIRPGINNWPAFSPDGRQIVFASSRDGDFEIYRMKRGRERRSRRLTESPAQDIRPRFSPDGKRIVFTSHRDGNANVYVMNADGSAVIRVTESPRSRRLRPTGFPTDAGWCSSPEHGGRARPVSW